MKPGVPRAHARANVILISLLPSSSSYCGNASVLGRVSILRHHSCAVQWIPHSLLSRVSFLHSGQELTRPRGSLWQFLFLCVFLVLLYSRLHGNIEQLSPAFSGLNCFPQSFGGALRVRPSCALRDLRKENSFWPSLLVPCRLGNSPSSATNSGKGTPKRLLICKALQEGKTTR